MGLSEWEPVFRGRERPCTSGEDEWRFETRGPDRTWIEVENRGFLGSPDEQVEKALDSAGGFALVLAGAKIWLEHGIEPRVVVDRHPDARVAAWRDR